MLLTSYNRMLRYLAGHGDDNMTNDVDNRRDILFWIPAISERIKNYLNRTIVIESRTEYFDINKRQYEFWVKNAPITTITSVKEDSTGQYDGSESTLDSSDYHIGTENSSVVLQYYRSYCASKALQIVYTGGLAYDPTKSVFAVASSTGWEANKFCVGSTSGAKGIISAVGTNELTIDVLFGKFIVSETITEYDEESETTAGATTTISSKTREALCEGYPQIVEACENEVRFMIQHKHDFENNSSERDGTTLRRDSHKRATLQPETRLLLDPLRVPIL